jgi:hypothetical protein
MKKCPFCAEEIQDSAIKCKHCGEFLSGQTPNLQQEPVSLPPAEQRPDWGASSETERLKPGADYGFFVGYPCNCNYAHLVLDIRNEPPPVA